MDGSRTTINDVAREAGVSRGTIYRVLNNKGYVSPQKREAVLETVRKLNFSPNIAAQVLASKKKFTIAVVYPTVEKLFWNEVESGIETAGKEFEVLGINVKRYPIEKFDLDEQRNTLKKLLHTRLDGLAIAPAHASGLNDIIGKFIKRNIPVVTFNSDAPDCGRVCHIGQDVLRSGSLAADLISLILGGNGEIAVFRAVRELLAIQLRVDGFKNRIESDYPFLKVVECVDFDESESKAYNLTKDIISKYPALKGIYVTNAYVNIVARAVSDMGLDRKIALVGFDINEDTRKYLQNGTVNAVICQEPFVQGYKPVQILNNLIIRDMMPEDEIIHTKLEILLPGNV